MADQEQRDRIAAAMMQLPEVNIEDRRDNPDMSPEWKNVPGSLSAIGTSLGNYLWGTPQIPEAPDSPLSDALGKRDVRLVPQLFSRSPLERGVDAIIDEFYALRKLGGNR